MEFSHIVKISSSCLQHNNFDLICIQESFLKPDKDYCPTGYHSVRSDRPTAKDGLITFVRNGLIYTEARRPADMEYQAVNVRTSLGTINVINVGLCTTDTGRRTACVRRSIPAQQHHHSRRHECQKRTMGSNTNDTRGRAL